MEFFDSADVKVADKLETRETLVSPPTFDLNFQIDSLLAVSDLDRIAMLELSHSIDLSQ
jgi:hypothetical protein